MAHYEVYEKTALHKEVFYSRDYRKAEHWVSLQNKPEGFLIREIRPLQMGAFDKIKKAG